MYEECKERAEGARDWWQRVEDWLAADDYDTFSAELLRDGYDISERDTVRDLLHMLIESDVLEIRFNGSRSASSSWEIKEVELITGVGGPTAWLIFEESHAGRFTANCSWGSGSFTAVGYAPELSAFVWELAE